MKSSNKIISSTLCMYLVLIFCWHAVFNLHYSMPHCMVPNCSNGWRKTKGTNITYSGSQKKLITFGIKCFCKTRRLLQD